VPEGDTIWRTARTLHAFLSGRTVTRFASTIPMIAGTARRLGILGREVAAVEAKGKHLLVSFSGGPVLHTHMRMTGSWHLYRSSTPWRKPAYRARVVVEAGDVVAVCFDAPVVELLSAGEAAAHPALAGLGPDVLADGFDPAEARARITARGEAEIGATLLDQTALAGIGNIYKSEVLFLAGINPFLRVSSLDPASLDRIIRTAAAQMKRSLASDTQPTTPADGRSRLWVYRRSNRPCRRCGATIRRRLQGEGARATYWCPTCQPLAGGASDAISRGRRRSR
jgi:endonuclease-8